MHVKVVIHEIMLTFGVSLAGSAIYLPQCYSVILKVTLKSTRLLYLCVGTFLQFGYYASWFANVFEHCLILWMSQKEYKW